MRIPKGIAVIECNLDESGIHEGAEVCVIAGYFGTKGQWRKVKKMWLKALSRFDVPLDEFHAKDLVKCVGFFHKWSEAESLELQLALAEAVARYRVFPVAQGVL
jgi:hypothetical protein